MNEEQVKKIIREELVNTLGFSSRIPREVDQSFRERFKFSEVKPSTKVSTSENQAVNEGGTASYNVLKTPDAFIQVEVNKIIYYIPAFT